MNSVDPSYTVVVNESVAALRTIYFELLTDAGAPANVATDGGDLEISFDNGDTFEEVSGTWLHVGDNSDGFYSYQFAVSEIDTVNTNPILKFASFGMRTKYMPILVRAAPEGGGGGDLTPVLTAISNVQDVVDNIQTDTTSIVATLAGMSPKIDVLYQIGTGRWKIQGTQLLIYEDDGTTVMLAFDLKNDVGTPSATQIFERVPTP